MGIFGKLLSGGKRWNGVFRVRYGVSKIGLMKGGQRFLIEKYISGDWKQIDDTYSKDNAIRMTNVYYDEYNGIDEVVAE